MVLYRHHLFQQSYLTPPDRKKHKNLVQIGQKYWALSGVSHDFGKPTWLMVQKSFTIPNPGNNGRFPLPCLQWVNSPEFDKTINRSNNHKMTRRVVDPLRGGWNLIILISWGQVAGGIREEYPKARAETSKNLSQNFEAAMFETQENTSVWKLENLRVKSSFCWKDCFLATSAHLRSCTFNWPMGIYMIYTSKV